jgi:hypothetical protein
MIGVASSSWIAQANLHAGLNFLHAKYWSHGIYLSLKILLVSAVVQNELYLPEQRS